MFFKDLTAAADRPQPFSIIEGSRFGVAPLILVTGEAALEQLPSQQESGPAFRGRGRSAAAVR